MRWTFSLGNLFRRKVGGDSQWTPSWRAAASLGGLLDGASSSGETVNTATAGALPSVYRAVCFISDSLSSVELRVVEQLPDGGKKPVEDTDAARALADWSFEDREA